MAGETSPLVTCSGAMSCGVPIMTPDLVRFEDSSRAMPKSINLARPSAETRMLSSVFMTNGPYLTTGSPSGRAPAC
ncbi:MAG: hypothetical protein Q8Q85_12375 [Gemmatimonadales bacterium]|nr:hypothetical protein [Gemmatimonadales bacterium]